MAQLVSNFGKYRREISDLKQIIYTLEAINEILESKVGNEILESKVGNDIQSQDFSDWTEITDQRIVFNMLTSYNDSIKKLILEEMITHPVSIQDTIQKYDLPQASTYRKIADLVDCGLIVRRGFFLQGDSKRVYKYGTAFKNMRVHFDGNKITMFVLPVRKNLEFKNLCKNIVDSQGLINQP